MATLFQSLTVAPQLVVRYSCRAMNISIEERSINTYASMHDAPVLTESRGCTTLLEGSKLSMQNKTDPFHLHSTLDHLVFLVLFRQSTRNGSVRTPTTSTVLLRLCDRLVDFCNKTKPLVHLQIHHRPGANHDNSPAYSSSPSSPTQNLIFSL